MVPMGPTQKRVWKKKTWGRDKRMGERDPIARLKRKDTSLQSASRKLQQRQIKGPEDRHKAQTTRRRKVSRERLTVTPCFGNCISAWVPGIQNEAKNPAEEWFKR